MTAHDGFRISGPRQLVWRGTALLTLTCLILVLGTGAGEAWAKPPKNPAPTGLQARAAAKEYPGPVVSGLQGSGKAPLKTVRPASQPDKRDWFAVMGDNFESGFPGSLWTLQNAGSGPDWGAWTCWANGGTHSVGCAAAGSGAITCGQNYPDNMQVWMTAGPYNLADPTITAAVLECFLNLNSETDYDYFHIMVSVDGTYYYGDPYSGPGSGLVQLDLANVPTLGSVLGQPQVWVGFMFESDESINALNGAQIDDVLLAVNMPASNQAPLVTVSSPNGGETWAAGSTHAITYTASDPDSGPSALTIALEYSTNSGGAWTAIASGQANSGTYSWTVPNLASTTARVRVTASDGADQTSDSSNADFTILQNSNALVLGQASGPSGTSVTVALSLDNEDPVKGIQTDITFDPARASFAGVTGTTRTTGMVVDGEQVAAGQARIILYFDTASQLAPGTGDVANLTFTLAGSAGSSTTLVLDEMILSGTEGDRLAVTGTDGALSVEAPTAVPGLQVAVLSNPGRVRSLQIMVLVTNGSGNAPTVTAGGSTVAMSQVEPSVFAGTYSVAEASTSVVVSASDINVQGTGTAQATVSFQ